MFIFKTIDELSRFINEQKTAGKVIGFVPTMGALHPGHISLIKAAQHNNQLTVCSIFVNPTQFNNPSDLEKYPRTTEADIALLHDSGCTILFLPSVEEIYPNGSASEKQYDLGYVETILDGAYRPGHFQGVAQVVERLLRIVCPDTLYLGQKDYQQCAVINRLIATEKLNIRVEIVPTMREADGLAMSSRNRRLTEPQRALAGVIYQCLVSIQTKQGLQQFSVVQKECREILEKKGFKPDYIEIAGAETLELLTDYVPGRKTVALVAAHLGDIRLIDNLLL